MLSKNILGSFQEKLSNTLALPDLNILAPLTLLLSPVVAFFNVQAFILLMLLLVVDFVTGIYKAKLLKKVCSSRFGELFDRAFAYTVIFICLHAFVLVFPMVQYIEVMTIGGYMAKELLSILENLQAIEIYKGKRSPMLDKLIERLGLDMDRILEGQEGVRGNDRTEA